MFYCDEETKRAGKCRDDQKTDYIADQFDGVLVYIKGHIFNISTTKLIRMEPSESKKILEMKEGKTLYRYDEYMSHRITENYLTIKVLRNKKEMMVTAYVKSDEEC